MKDIPFNKMGILQLAENTIKLNPDPIPRYLLLRDVLQLKADDPKLSEAKMAASKSKWVNELMLSQHENGSWGRFHTEDTKLKQKFRTTEIAVRRCAAIGLDMACPFVNRSIKYMEDVLDGEALWSDWVESPDSWNAAVELITASTLCEVDPGNARLKSVWQKWRSIAELSFVNHEYDLNAEISAAQRVHNVNFRSGSLSSRYALKLLGYRIGKLPKELDFSICNWIWNSEKGIRYLKPGRLADNPTDELYASIKAKLSSIEILINYSSIREFSEGSLRWLWGLRKGDGLWDFGKLTGERSELPYSENLRNETNRKIDYTVRILRILSRLVTS
jgi:hypothetical protein